MDNSQKLVCAFLCLLFGSMWLLWGIANLQLRPGIPIHWLLFGLAIFAYALFAAFVASILSPRFSRAVGCWLNKRGG